jgi:hypothetical protein
MTEMVGSLGRNAGRPFGRNRVLTNSQLSAAHCAECSIAMLIIPIRGEAGCGSCCNEISRGSAATMDGEFESQSNDYDE